MKTRIGRLNKTEFINNRVIRKISIVQEAVRPFRLKIEGWALSQAKIIGINVPQVLDYYIDKNGREVLVLERISGKHLVRRCLQENIACMSKVGDQIISLGKAPLNCGWGWINQLSMTGISRSWRSFLQHFIETYHQIFIEKDILEESHFQIVRYALANIDLVISKSCLIHRDIKPANIINGSDGRVWIIDWENTILGDPLYDLATFGARYGHGVLWKSLTAKYKPDFSTPKYILYEILVLVGLIDFYREYNTNYSGRRKQLRKLIQRLSSSLNK